MPYTKQTWTDEVPVSSPVKYKITDDSSGVIANSAKIEVVTSVTSGSPLNATRLNYMETGIETAQSAAESAATAASAAQTTANAAIPKSIVTAIGQLIYSTAAGVLAALAKPVVASILKMAADGTPSWLAVTAIPGMLHAKATAYTDTLVGTTSTVFDYTGTEATVTLTTTCTIVASFVGMGTKNTAAYAGYYTLEIDGTEDSNANVGVKSTENIPIALEFEKSGVAPGSRTVKVKFKTDNSADAVRLRSGRLYVRAFAE